MFENYKIKKSILNQKIKNFVAFLKEKEIGNNYYAY
jgi:hypothetical protein